VPQEHDPKNRDVLIDYLSANFSTDQPSASKPEN